MVGHVSCYNRSPSQLERLSPGKELGVLPEFCTLIRASSPKAPWERRFKILGNVHQIPSREGRKPKASGWVLMTKNPPRRCAPPLQEGIFKRPAIHMQNSGTNLSPVPVVGPIQSSSVLSPLPVAWIARVRPN